MAKLGCWDSVVSDAGAPVPAAITVYNAGTETKATIYTTAAGDVVKDNPFITDSLGRFQFFASAGAYDVQVSGTGITTYKIENVQLSDITQSTQLTDMPGTLAGQTLKGLRVKADESGYEHVTLGGSAGIVPVGSIIPYQGGYFTDGSNAGFAMVMATANTVAAVNTLLNSSGWYVCNGAALNHASSPIWTGAGRYLPNLTDDRFLMGDTLAGGIGGSNSSAHTHVAGTYALAHTHVAGSYVGPAHTHTIPAMTTGGTGADKPIGTETNDATPAYHTHTIPASTYNTGSNGTGAITGTSGAASSEAVTGSSGAASATQNRPAYLSCFYIVRAF